MRDNSKDLTLERNYIQKWRFLIHEYQLVKAGSMFPLRPGLLLLALGQTFAKYYNRLRVPP